MFTSYRIGFSSFSQNYTVWCEHTFSSNIYVEYEFKNVDHILMCFDGKNNHLKKKLKQEKVQQ